MKRIEIFDSTLRDGAQGEGISFSVEDKHNIVRLLDELGVAYVEAGNPGSNPKDLEFFRRAGGLNLKNAELVAFGSTAEGDTVEEEKRSALLTANTKAVALFGKAGLRKGYSPHHRRRKLCDDFRYGEFLQIPRKKVILTPNTLTVQSNPILRLNRWVAAVAGATYLVLCDTNGGAFPNEVFNITKSVVSRFNIAVGIHVHNDGGLAVANSIMAVEAGAVHVQGTYLGFGERSGNANLSTIIPNLQLKQGYRCIPAENMQLLTPVARSIAEIANVRLYGGEPYVGSSAFAHKAGMHADGC